MRNEFLDIADQLERAVLHETSSFEEYINLPPSELFEEEPVPLATFLYDRKYLFLPPLSSRQFDFVLQGTQVYYNPTLQAMKWPFSDPYKNEGVAMWGKGSGKDTVARIILSRIADLVMNLKDPQRYYNIMPGDSINMINVAYSSNQAQTIFFEPLKKMLGRSPHFKDKIEPLENRIKFLKEVNLYSGHSEADSLEGHNLIAAVADEIGAFKAKLELEVRQRRSARALEHSADAILDMLRSSATSRFPEIYKLIQISYPRYDGDPITLAVAEYRDNPRAFVSGPFATWEVNPTKKQEQFAEEYRKNPENAKARYECKPPKAVDQYFKAFTPELQEVTFPFAPEEARLLDDQNKVKPWVKGESGIVYFAHVDLALKKDRAGLCVTHNCGTREREIIMKGDDGIVSSKRVTEALVSVDILTGFTAPVGGEIDFEEVRKILFTLFEERGFYFKIVTYDGWQSVDSIQQLIKHGIEADTFSVDRNTEAYDSLKDVMYGKRLFGYRTTESIDKCIVIDELLHLKKITGNKIDHQLGGSKDEADALAAAVRHAVSEQYGHSTLGDVVAFAPYEERFGSAGKLDSWKGDDNISFSTEPFRYS